MSFDFVLGFLTCAILHPFLTQIYRHIRWMLALRAITKQFQGESRAEAKARAGEWRDD
jgi:hypothetical protein